MTEIKGFHDWAFSDAWVDYEGDVTVGSFVTGLFASTLAIVSSPFAIAGCTFDSSREFPELPTSIQPDAGDSTIDLPPLPGDDTVEDPDDDPDGGTPIDDPDPVDGGDPIDEPDGGDSDPVDGGDVDPTDGGGAIPTDQYVCTFTATTQSGAHLSSEMVSMDDVIYSASTNHVWSGVFGFRDTGVNSSDAEVIEQAEVLSNERQFSPVRLWPDNDQTLPDYALNLTARWMIDINIDEAFESADIVIQGCEYLPDSDVICEVSESMIFPTTWEETLDVVSPIESSLENEIRIAFQSLPEGMQVGCINANCTEFSGSWNVGLLEVEYFPIYITSIELACSVIVE